MSLSVASMEYVIVSNMSSKMSLVIDDTMTVAEVRAVIMAMLDVSDNQTIRLTFNGKTLHQDELMWGEIVQRAHHNNVSAQDRKVFCIVSARSDHQVGGVDALRIAFASQQDVAAKEKEAREHARKMEPLVDAMVSNPGFVESMLQSTPQMQQLMKKHPDVAREMNNPEFMKRIVMSQFNPDYNRELSRSMDLQFAQLSTIPGAQQILEGYVNGMKRDLEGNMQRTESDLHAASEEHARPQAGKEVNNDVLPNPWEAAQTMSAAPLRMPSAQTGQPHPFMNPFMALGQSPGASMMNNYNNSNPNGWLERMMLNAPNPSSSPALNWTAPGSYTPHVDVTTGQSSMRGGDNSYNSSTYADSSRDQTNSHIDTSGGAVEGSMLTVVQGTASDAVRSQATASVPTTQQTQQPQHTTAMMATRIAQVNLLKEMGFEDESLCHEALQSTEGDVEEAVQYIVKKRDGVFE